MLYWIVLKGIAAEADNISTAHLTTATTDTMRGVPTPNLHMNMVMWAASARLKMPEMILSHNFDSAIPELFLGASRTSSRAKYLIEWAGLFMPLIYISFSCCINARVAATLSLQDAPSHSHSFWLAFVLLWVWCRMVELSQAKHSHRWTWC